MFFCVCLCTSLKQATAWLVADLRGQVPLHSSVGAHTLTNSPSTSFLDLSEPNRQLPCNMETLSLCSCMLGSSTGTLASQGVSFLTKTHRHATVAGKPSDGDTDNNIFEVFTVLTSVCLRSSGEIHQHRVKFVIPL